MSKSVTLCPLCNGALELRRDRTYQFKFKGQTYTLEGLERWVCCECGTGMSGNDTAARNQEAIRGFQRSIAGKMAPLDILTLREKYCMSQEQATRIFDTARRAFSKWERGEVAPNAGLANIMRLALDNPEFMRFMAEAAGETVDLPPPQKMVPHAEVVALLDQLAKREQDDQKRYKESYEAGMKEGMRRQHQISIPSFRVERGAFGQSNIRDEVPVDVLVWQQKEKSRLGKR